jgi:hypothetical protein
LVPRGFGLGSFHCIKKIPIHPYDKIFMSKEGLNLVMNIAMKNNLARNISKFEWCMVYWFMEDIVMETIVSIRQNEMCDFGY